jgi:hypothetical protein
MIEIQKLIKSRTILFMLIIMLLLSLSFSVFALKGISSGLALDDKQKISSEFNFELIYYCMPLFILSLADFIFNKDIFTGTMKHLIIKSDRRTIYLYKMISLIVVAVLLNLLFNLTNSQFIKYKLDIAVAGRFLRASLRESIPIIEMSLLFALVSILSKKNNFVYLISLHFIFLFLTESSLLLGKYTYLNDFKMAILDGGLSTFSIIKIIVLTLITYQIFKNKELAE